MKTTFYSIFNRKFLVVFLIFLLFIRIQECLATNSSQNSKNHCVIHALQKILVEEPIPRKIESFEDLLDAFSHGLIPDFTQASHRDAFEVYRRLKLGNPNTELNPNSLEEIKIILQKYPDLTKESFRDYNLLIQEKIYPVTPELESYINSQLKNAGQIRANLFKIDSNTGYWKKIFQYNDENITNELKIKNSLKTASNAEKSILREEIKSIKKKQNLDWLEFLNSKLPPELRKELQDSNRSARARATALYKILSTEREKMASADSAELKDLRPISQAIIDLIHTIGFDDSILVQGLKSSDGMERLNSYRKILDERDRFAIELGFEDHFKQVLQKFGSPADIQGTFETLYQLEHGVMSGKLIESNATTRAWKIRHLSLVESPFRSCLGGSDCSSRTYFTRALDPNYHYFTLTDESGVSSGHITVVLGEGRPQSQNNSEKIKVGFIDKIQNISHTLLPQMIEGIRQSLKEKGYRLVIPDDLGNHNGLSNEEITRNFVSKNIQKNKDQSIFDFKPHSHSYLFPNKFSRADDGLTSKEVIPLNLTSEIKILPGDLNLPWKIQPEKEGLNLHTIIMKSAELGNSVKLEDRLRYIPTIRSILSAGVDADPNFELTLTKWLHNPIEPFQLRKQVLIYFWLEKLKPLSTLLPFFNETEKLQLIQNFLETPKYREKILNDKEILYFVISTRKSKKTREILLNSYLDNKKEYLLPLINQILDARDFSDSRAQSLIDEIKLNWKHIDLEGLIKIHNLVEKTSLEKSLIPEAFENFNSKINTQTTLGKVLLQCFSSLPYKNSFLLKLGNQLLKGSSINPLQNNSVIHAFKEIKKIQKKESLLHDFPKAAELWIRDPNVDPELKIRFLLSAWGDHHKMKNLSFEFLQKKIPNIQIKEIMERMDQITHLRIFQKIAESSNNQAAIQIGKLESFEFQHFSPLSHKNLQPIKTFPNSNFHQKEKSSLHEVTLTQPFEIQSTPVTQLQWSLVMGENPASIRDQSFILQMEEREIPMNPNERVDQISWEEIQIFIRKLNEIDPSYHYRLPTEAEWEYAVRTGKRTNSTINQEEEEELFALGWNPSTSEQLSTEVATRPANSNGLYDTEGNTWEWVQDRWSHLSSGHFIDPTGPSEGTNRVIRGGCKNQELQEVCSLPRGSSYPNFRSPILGFRLVRVPKI